MTEEVKFLKYISQFEIPAKKLNEITEPTGKPSIDRFLGLSELGKFFRSETIEDMCIKASEENVRSYFHNLEEQHIGIVTKYDPEWPEKFVGNDDFPLYLFYKGDLSLMKKTSIAIVGSRETTNYGRIVTDRFAAELAEAGIVIVSGLAYGVDSIAHRKCLEVGGKTIAVLGCGFNRMYPAEHTNLAREIAEKGLLLSEYCPSTKAGRYTFPYRNRIVAALSDGVLITEAGLKSGTVHTKNYALDYGKTVYCVPGNITSEKSELTNTLIAAHHAQCVVKAKDILDDLDIVGYSKPKARVMQLGLVEEKIVEILKNGEKDIDFLAEKCEISVISLNTYLTTMEISGIIRRMPGGYFALA